MAEYLEPVTDFFAHVSERTTDIFTAVWLSGEGMMLEGGAFVENSALILALTFASIMVSVCWYHFRAEIVSMVAEGQAKVEQYTEQLTGASPSPKKAAASPMKSSPTKMKRARSKTPKSKTPRSKTPKSKTPMKSTPKSKK